MARGRVGAYTLADAKKYIRRKLIQYREARRSTPADGTDKIGYAIEFNGKLVGGIGYTPFGQTAEVGYWLAKPYWGRGIMTTALRVFLKYLKRRQGLARFEARIFGFNPASGRVLEKCGFRRAALAVKDLKIGRRFESSVIYVKETGHARYGT